MAEYTEFQKSTEKDKNYSLPDGTEIKLNI
jgi:hypothetical protein